MKKIAITTLKGGTGKSTFTFNFAGYLAKKHPEMKILMIDIDPQCDLSASCGINVFFQDATSVNDIFVDGSVKPQDIVIESPLDAVPNLDIIPANIGMFETQMNLYSAAGREFILDNYFKANKKFFNSYDYIIFDTHPDVNVLNLNAFYTVDSIVLVSDTSEASIRCAELFLYLWGRSAKALRKKDNVKALVINRFVAREKLSKELWEYVSDNDEFKDLLVKPAIPSRTVMQSSTIEHRPVFTFKSSERGSLNYTFNEIIEGLEEKGVL